MAPSRNSSTILTGGLAGTALAALMIVYASGGWAQGIVADSDRRSEASQRPVRLVEPLRAGETARTDPRPTGTVAQGEFRDGIPSPGYETISEGALPDESADLYAHEALLGEIPDDGLGAEGEAAPLPASGADARRGRQAGADDTRERPSRRRQTSADGEADAGDGRETTDVRGERTGRRTADEEERNQRAEAVAERVEAIEGRDREEEEEPYEALGLRVGTFELRPSLEQGVRWTSNAYSSADPEASVLSETTLRLEAESDWSRHAATLNAVGTFRRSVGGARIVDGEGEVEAGLRLDIVDGLRGVGDLRYALSPESVTSPNFVGEPANRPLRHEFEGGIGLEKDVGKARFSIRGRLERTLYGDARLSNGTTVSQRDRNTTLAVAVLRGGYAVTPALVPFVEIEAGRRFYDQRTDSAGYRRSANRYGARLGTAFDFTEKLTGEVSAGWIAERFDDARLRTVSGLAADASLTWSPVRLTTITIGGNTAVEGSTSPGDSGAIVYSATVEAERRLRANLTGTVSLGASLRDYAGSNATDLTLTAEAGMTWWLNRHAGLSGSARHETFKAAGNGQDTRTNSVFLGLVVRP